MYVCHGRQDGWMLIKHSHFIHRRCLLHFIGHRRHSLLHYHATAQSLPWFTSRTQDYLPGLRCCCTCQPQTMATIPTFTGDGSPILSLKGWISKSTARHQHRLAQRQLARWLPSLLGRWVHTVLISTFSSQSFPFFSHSPANCNPHLLEHLVPFLRRYLSYFIFLLVEGS